MTDKELTGILNLLGKATGIKTTAKWNAKTRKYSNDFLALDSAYGGVKLVKVMKNTSQVELGDRKRRSKAQMAEYMRALMDGIDLKKYKK